MSEIDLSKKKTRPTEEVLLVGRDRDGEIHVVDLGVLGLTLMHVDELRVRGRVLSVLASKAYDPGIWLRTRDRVDEEGRPIFVHSDMIAEEDMHPVLRRTV